MKIRNILCAALTAALLFCACLSANASGYTDVVSAPGGSADSAEALYAALGGDDSARLEDGVITVMRDITLAAPILLEDGQFTVRGAGCVMTAAFSEGDLFTVGEGASLILGIESDKSDASLTVAGGSTVRLLNISGSCTLYSGIRLEGGCADLGGAVLVSGGSLLLDGASVLGCKADRGGAVYLSSGELLISDGLISGCTADEGGAIYMESGRTDMTGGCIGAHESENDGGGIDRYGEANTATLGGGICAAGGELSLSGGEISECEAEQGGCLYLSADAYAQLGAVMMRAGVASRGGCVYSEGTISDTRAAIRGGTAKSGRGGCVYNAGAYTKSEGDISEGTADLGGGVYNAGAFTLSDGSIIKCNALQGGGVYNSGSFRFEGGVLGYSKADTGDAFLNLGELSMSGTAYVYDGNAIGLVIGSEDESAGYITAESEFSGAEVMASVDLFRVAKNGSYKSVRGADGPILRGDASLISGAAEHLSVRAGGRALSLREDGSVSPDLLPIIISVCAAAALAVIASAAILIRKKMKAKTVAAASDGNHSER